VRIFIGVKDDGASQDVAKTGNKFCPGIQYLGITKLDNEYLKFVVL